MHDNTAMSRGRSTTPGRLTWNEDMNEATYQMLAEAWVTNVRKTVGKKCFNFMQFVLEVHEHYGSTWQKIVCETVRVPENMRERFWEDKGKKTARTTINRRRQNTATAMKKKFKGERAYYQTVHLNE